LSEQEVRDGLKLAVAEEPPMNFDVDELMTKAERLVRRRRALIAVGASTAAVAVAAVAIPVFLGTAPQPDNLPMAAPPQASSMSSPTPTTLPKAPAHTKQELTERGAQMQAHLQTQLPLVVPKAKDVKAGLFGGEAEGAVEDGQRYLGSFVKFILGAPTAIEVQTQNDQDNMDRTCTAAGCQQIPQADGSVVVVQPVDVGNGNASGMLLKSAVHFRNDGSVVRVTTYNYDPTGQDAPTFQPDVALTVEQLTRLATDPAIHL
jgi:hypothetical protein